MKIAGTIFCSVVALIALLNVNTDGAKLYIKIHHQDKFFMGDGPVDQEVVQLEQGGRWDREMNDYFDSVETSTGSYLKEGSESHQQNTYDWNSYRMFEDLQTTTPRMNHQVTDKPRWYSSFVNGAKHTKKFLLDTFFTRESSIGGVNKPFSESIFAGQDQLAKSIMEGKFQKSSKSKSSTYYHERVQSGASDVISEDTAINQHREPRVKRSLQGIFHFQKSVKQSDYRQNDSTGAPLKAHILPDNNLNKKVETISSASVVGSIHGSDLGKSRTDIGNFGRSNGSVHIKLDKNKTISNKFSTKLSHHFRLKRSADLGGLIDPNEMWDVGYSTTRKYSTSNILDDFKIDENDIKEGEKNDIKFIIKMIFVTLGVVVLIGVFAFFFVKDPRKCIVSFGMGCPCITYACPCIWNKIERMIDPTIGLHEGINMYMPGLIVREDKKVEHYTPTQEEMDAAIDLMMEIM